MLIPFNTTVLGVFWRYQIKAVPLHRHSEKPPPLVFSERQELITNLFITKNH